MSNIALAKFICETCYRPYVNTTVLSLTEANSNAGEKKNAYWQIEMTASIISGQTEQDGNFSFRNSKFSSLSHFLLHPPLTLGFPDLTAVKYSNYLYTNMDSVAVTQSD